MEKSIHERNLCLCVYVYGGRRERKAKKERKNWQLENTVIIFKPYKKCKSQKVF